MMTQAIIGKPVSEVRPAAVQVDDVDRDRRTGRQRQRHDDRGTVDALLDLGPLGDLAALQGVVKSGTHQGATLAWNTLIDALDNPDPAATTAE